MFIEIAKISSDKIQEIVTLSEKLGNETAYCKLIYQSCPMFQSKEFQEQYKPVEPFEVVKMFFDGFALDFWALGNENAKGVEELRKKFNDLGMGMSDEAINASVKLTDTMDTLKRSFQGCVYTVGADLMPIFQSLADTLQNNMPQIKATVVPVFKNIAEIVQFVIKHIKAITIATTLCVASFVTFKTLSFVGGVLTSISETIEITKGGIGLLKVANYALGQSADFANAKITLMFGWQKLKGVIEAVTTAQWGLNTAVTAFSRISIILILAEIIIHFKDICKWTKNATDVLLREKSAMYL